LFRKQGLFFSILRLIPSSRSGSGGATPVRKVSAHEFEKGGLTKPLVTTIDGTPTFLSPPSHGSELTGQIRKKSRTDMSTLDETELILELVKDICNDLDVRSLCHKILQNVGILTYADRCSLFLVAGDPAANHQCQYLVSNLFDVSSNSTVEEVRSTECPNKKLIVLFYREGKHVFILSPHAETIFVLQTFFLYSL
jgi:dual 3',5'-cyclic-AMP and -GMP phosphodiesterase 11